MYTHIIFYSILGVKINMAINGAQVFLLKIFDNLIIFYCFLNIGINQQLKKKKLHKIINKY